MDADNAAVFVVDDDAVTRQDICQLVETVGLVGKPFASGEEFLRSYDPEQVGCVILDVRMPGMSGLALHRQLQEKNSCLPIIFLTGYGDVPMAVDAVKEGAFHFFQKPFRPQLLLDSIQKAIQESVQRRVSQGELAKYQELKMRLTARERQVMEMLVAGKPNKVIAYELGLSPKTIDYHRHHIMKKTSVGTVIQLVRQALGFV